MANVFPSTSTAPVNGSGDIRLSAHLADHAHDLLDCGICDNTWQLAAFQKEKDKTGAVQRDSFDACCVHNDLLYPFCARCPSQILSRVHHNHCDHSTPHSQPLLSHDQHDP